MSKSLYIERSEKDEAALCICSNCSWRGLAGETTEVEDGVLTPGDASPVGRCPDTDCEALCYLDRPADRQKDKAADLREALKRIISLADEAIELRKRSDDTEDHETLDLLEGDVAKARDLLKHTSDEQYAADLAEATTEEAAVA